MIAAGNWAITRISSPTFEPVTLTEAKGQLRRDDITIDDALITSLIIAARAHIEDVTNRAICTQIFELVLDEWPCGDVITIPRSPLQSVTSLKYTDSSGTQATWATTNYIVDTDSKPGRVCLAYGVSWPSSTLRPANAIRIRFVAGYGSEFTFTTDASTNELTAAAHGLVDGDDVLLSSTGALPPGLAADTRYHVVSASTNTFKVSAMRGGPAADIASTGTGVYTASRGVPLPLRHAILMLAAHYYQNRESVLVGGLGLVAAEMPQSVQSLIAPYRTWAF